MPDLYDADATPVAEHAAFLAKVAAGQTVDTGGDAFGALAAAITAVLADRGRLAALADLARRVRAAQKRYFRDRTGLEECKALESKLDGALKE